MGNRIKRLAIVGNGLDLHHGIKSRYKNFYYSDYMPGYLRDKYDLLTANCHTGDNWFDFEEEYRSLIANELCLVEKGYGSNNQGLSDDNKNQFIPRVNLINNVFQTIKKCFLVYLKSEYEEAKNNSNFRTDPTVGKHLCAADIILNFNYTNSISDIYGVDSSKIIHVHGGLNGNAILGHSNYCDYDVATGNATNYGFRMNVPDLRETAYKGDKTIQRIEAWNNSKQSSGKVIDSVSIDTGVISSIKIIAQMSDYPYDILDDFYENPFAPYVDKNDGREYCNKLALNFNDTIEVTIIGHGLKSDIDLLSKLPVSVRELTVLKRNHNDTSIVDRGKKVFKPHNVVSDYYEWE